MAKKKKLEDTEAPTFEFPEFDEVAFIAHEAEQTFATAYALIFAVALAVASFLIDWVAGPAPPGGFAPLLFVPVVLGVAVAVASPFAIGRLRPLSKEYTKGDWASLILIEVFGWIGIWFVLTDLLLH